jgi:hypothetical protein
MSALGHEQTSRPLRVMSVIPLKADIRRRIEHVCFVPEADVGNLAPPQHALNVANTRRNAPRHCWECAVAAQNLRTFPSDADRTYLFTMALLGSLSFGLGRMDVSLD